MFKTRVTEKLGIKHPIIGGTMMYLSDPPYVSAISNAGCLGIICSAMYKSEGEFRDAIKKTKDLTDQPFAVNLNLFPAMRAIDNNVYLKVIIDEGVKIIETSGHKAPEELVGDFKKAGITWIHKCVGLRYAQKAASLGADMITVVGYENGGATGVLDLGSLVLIRKVARELKIPVIGGGGISDGEGLAAALALGAEGVIMGTRFLLVDECPIHDKIKRALEAAQETDTVLIMRTIGNTHRVWKNQKSDLIVDLESKHATLEELVTAAAGKHDRAMFESGDTTGGIISTGQGIGLISETKPVKAVVEEIIKEAEQAVKRLGGLIG